MPPEFRFGYPLEEGALYPEDRSWFGISVKSDGTRRIDRSVPKSRTSDYVFRVFGSSSMDGDAATGTDVGLIPAKTTNPTIDRDECCGKGRRYWQPGTSEPLAFVSG